MSKQTHIEWCDSTFNPWIGCTKVSPACDDCYAARSSPARALGVAWGAQAARHHTSAANWAQPRRWNAKRFMQCQACGWRGELAAELIGCGACGSTDHLQDARRRVFCASLADVFDNAVPVQWRIELIRLIMETPNLDWLLLTKRIGNAAEMLETAFRGHRAQLEGWRDNVPPHVWIGATVCNQAEADRDIPKLLAVPAAKRFLSIEPMLGPIGLRFPTKTWAPGRCNHCCNGDRCDDPSHYERSQCPYCRGTGRQKFVDWVICGGESGPKARPMHADWARALRDQCAVAGVPFLFKQWGEWGPDWEGAETCNACGRSKFDAVNSYGECGHCGLDAWAKASKPLDSLRRVGKKAAGRMLDGRQHDGVPS